MCIKCNKNVKPEKLSWTDISMLSFDGKHKLLFKISPWKDMTIPPGIVGSVIKVKGIYSEKNKEMMVRNMEVLQTKKTFSSFFEPSDDVIKYSKELIDIYGGTLPTKDFKVMVKKRFNNSDKELDVIIDKLVATKDFELKG